MLNLEIRDVTAIIRKASEIMNDNKELLCELDSQLGDGDLGITMAKGWAAAADAASSPDLKDIGKMLLVCGMKMASSAPSTMGTLMASGLIESGKCLKGKTTLNIEDLSVLITAFCDGIKKRGRCEPGDRTVLDSLWPAAQSTAKFNSTTTIEEAVALMREASLAGLENTKNLIPKHGKAAVFAARAIGKYDQGAYAGFLFIDAFYQIIDYLLLNKEGETKYE